MSKPNTFYQIRKRIITGFLIIAPLGATVFILKWLLSLLATVLAPIVKFVLGERSPYLQATLSIVLLLCLLYLVGLLGSNLTGRWMIDRVEAIVERIPLVSKIYASIRNVIHTFRTNTKASFERVVWVKFPTQEAFAIGFVTGTISQPEGRSLIKVFVPTSPNPTSGFLIVVQPEATWESGMTVEQALQMIISGGIVSPDTISAPLP